MHELSIAVTLVEFASEEAVRLGAVRVDALHLRIGPLSGVLKEALSFSFTMAAQGTPVEGARLEIEDVPVTVWCAACEAERRLASVSHRRCPVCDAVAPDIVRGADLELVGLEVVDA